MRLKSLLSFLAEQYKLTAEVPKPSTAHPPDPKKLPSHEAPMKAQSSTLNQTGHKRSYQILSSTAALLGLLLMLVNASAAQVVSDVFSFTGANGSTNPVYVTPTQGKDGKLYGTTSGIPNSNGAIFKVSDEWRGRRTSSI